MQNQLKEEEKSIQAYNQNAFLICILNASVMWT